jgi:peptidoglycan-N-acetylglucosamine deacetylase
VKKTDVILLIAILLAAVNTSYSRTIDPNYEIGTWSGFRTAAVSYVSDAAYLQNIYDIGVPMFNSYGFKLSLFEIPNWGPPWAKAQAAAAQGHELASLLMNHENLPDLTTAQATSTLSQSQIVINSYLSGIPGSQCLIVGYPNCNIAYKSLIAQYYIAARTCSASINTSTPSDFYAINSLIVGSASSLNSTASIVAKHNQAASSGGWVVYLVHAIDSEAGYSPISSTVLNGTLQYLDTHRSTFWVNNFLNVVKYIKERNDASVSETYNTGDSITLSVTDTLSNTIYNYPITIRRPMPSGWLAAKVSQNGLPVNYSIVKVGSVKYLMFDVVPDGGDVVLSEDLYGNFTDPNTIGFEDLYVFGGYWLASDCNITAPADIDNDCWVDFYEFAFLAADWQQEF